MDPLKSTDPDQIGPYRLAGRLGAGGMGVVYLGISATADRFAIKVINPALVSNEEFRSRFAAEVETLRTITGSRVARLERAALTDDPPWLAVVYVPGRSLQVHVETAGVLGTRAGAMTGALLMDGLRSVHEAGMVHRDLKPANVMLDPSGPILIDFGLAVLREREVHLTGTGQPVGTLAYMSPEQARGERDLTTATDVYALGATLVYALTGHTVYPRDNPIAMLGRILDAAVLPNSVGVPAELSSLVDGMLAYEPAARPNLDTAASRLLQVATIGRASPEEVREELARETYVDQPLRLPDWAINPTAEDTDAMNSELDSTRPDSRRLTTAVAAPTEPTATTVATPLADITWLVDELRTAYARKATL